MGSAGIKLLLVASLEWSISQVDRKRQIQNKAVNVSPFPLAGY